LILSVPDNKPWWEHLAKLDLGSTPLFSTYSMRHGPLPPWSERRRMYDAQEYAYARLDLQKNNIETTQLDHVHIMWSFCYGAPSLEDLCFFLARDRRGASSCWWWCILSCCSWYITLYVNAIWKPNSWSSKNYTSLPLQTIGRYTSIPNLHQKMC
jgi:hypothetical protein